MTHDPMCPQPNCDFGEPDGHCYGWEDCDHACQCWLIDRVRKDERFYALRDAVHIVEQMLDEYPYDSEGYRAITTAGNRLRISAGTEE